jgi:hypothetical protein
MDPPAFLHRAIVGDLATSSALISFLWIYPVSLYSSIDQSLPASHGVEKKNSWGSNPFRNDDSMNPLASGRLSPFEVRESPSIVAQRGDDLRRSVAPDIQPSA